MKRKFKISDIERLNALLTAQQFSYKSLTRDTSVSLVRIQIAIDAPFEEVRRAREKAEKQFMSERLKELYLAQMRGEISIEEEKEFKPLASEYNTAYEKVIINCICCRFNLYNTQVRNPFVN
ncbi:hypothetical protein EZS27_037239 [termite gut metagenome]|uniref:Uncharacterized protein n=1 Tax=termite gut metagenome TaxID=433724 RepID=A0A5J4PTR2_9ZZZZ